MSTSNSTTYALNAGQMITRAYQLLGVLNGAGDVPDEDQYQRAIQSLNMMLKDWQMDGTNLWRETQVSLTVQAGQGCFGNPIELSPLVLDVSEARWVQTPAPNQYERQLGRNTYFQYTQQSNKLQQTGSPFTFMFDRQVAGSNLYIWPLLNAAGTINCTVARSVEDVIEPTDTLDVPIFAQQAVLYNLADRLMEDNGLGMTDAATAARITQRAETFYTKLKNFDRPTSIFFLPYGKNRSGFYK